ncbi:MAG: GDP-mannose 4,6-dehydratase [Candidatus Rokubacteria bacterium]|nr:GDP-mannose 4,6-dehydratase [Candidatus Rokubacteria bacterium]
MSQVALITGITGQDGSYLAELLLSKGYVVHGLIRRSSTFNTSRIDHLYKDPHDPAARLFLHHGDLADATMLTNRLYELRPDEVYHLGAQSHVRVSFDMPDYTGDVTGLSTVRLLEAIRLSGIRCRLYQASSSEMFGDAPAPQHEGTPFQPRSPYAAAKLYAYWVARNYREGYGLFVCNGIMFNHESPRRGPTFVSRKITMAVAAILAGKQEKLFLGNLDARRDWGFAPDYVEAMWQMLQADAGADLVFGTGETHTVQEFLEEAFAYVKLDWRRYVAVDPRYLRPTEVPVLLADASNAKRTLGWEARVRFRDLVRIMLDADLEAAGLSAPGEGRRALAAAGISWLQRP